MSKYTKEEKQVEAKEATVVQRYGTGRRNGRATENL